MSKISLKVSGKGMIPISQLKAKFQATCDIQEKRNEDLTFCGYLTIILSSAATGMSLAKHLDELWEMINSKTASDVKIEQGGKEIKSPKEIIIQNENKG